MFVNRDLVSRVTWRSQKHNRRNDQFWHKCLRDIRTCMRTSCDLNNRRRQPRYYTSHNISYREFCPSKSRPLTRKPFLNKKVPKYYVKNLDDFIGIISKNLLSIYNITSAKKKKTRFAQNRQIIINFFRINPPINSLILQNRFHSMPRVISKYKKKDSNNNLCEYCRVEWLSPFKTLFISLLCTQWTKRKLIQAVNLTWDFPK